MKQIERANYFFAILQGIWVLLYFAARIWATQINGTSEERFRVQAEVAGFFWHVGSALAQWGAAYDHVSNLRWRFLIPLFLVQLMNGIFTVINVGQNSVNHILMNRLWEFNLYGVGIYQLSILVCASVYYIYHAFQVREEKVKKVKKDASLLLSHYNNA